MKPAPHVRANLTDDGLVILDIDKGSIYSANSVAARIWQMLMDGKSEQDAVETVAQEFNAPRDVVEKDAKDFIASLWEKELVVEA